MKLFPFKPATQKKISLKVESNLFSLNFHPRLTLITHSILQKRTYAKLFNICIDMFSACPHVTHIQLLMIYDSFFLLVNFPLDISLISTNEFSHTHLVILDKFFLVEFSTMVADDNKNLYKAKRAYTDRNAKSSTLPVFDVKIMKISSILWLLNAHEENEVVEKVSTCLRLQAMLRLWEISLN